MKDLEQSIRDLQDDFDELEYLYQQDILKFQRFEKDIKKNKKNISFESFQFITLQLQQYQSWYHKKLEEISEIKKTLQKKDVFKSITAKNTYYLLFRNQTVLTAALIISTDFQSPSFSHSQHSLAGRQEGHIIATWNDYKRDTHLDALYLEKLFWKKYIEASWKFNLQVLLVQSGMGAFTTILNHLQMHKKIQGTILLGKSSYFQNKEIVQKIFGKRVIEFDESRTDEIITIIEKKKPQILIFDSLCNSYDIAVPNVSKIIEYISKETKIETYIILDNTGLSVFYQLFKKASFSKKVNIIGFESLNKYHQFGLDRTTGGVIYSTVDKKDLFLSREHLGTNITDVSVYMIPLPNRKLLEKRMKRIERNTLEVAQFLLKNINNKMTKLETIFYPGLPNHPAFGWTKDLKFSGSFFTLNFKKKYQTISFYKRFVQLVIKEANRKSIQIVSGTSFGMNNTRIYLTAENTEYGKPFIRISLGTETALEIEKIKEVFLKVIEII